MIGEDLEFVLSKSFGQRRILPDGRYITNSWNSFDTLKLELTRLWRSWCAANTESLPQLIVGFGRCRVGSTALTNAFGACGVPALFQPFKVGLRNALASPDWLSEPMVGFNLNSFPQKQIFCKEMFGPFTWYESLWNPFEAILEFYPAHLVSGIWLERDPLDSLDSWHRKWGSLLDAEFIRMQFMLASISASRLAERMEEKGMRLFKFNYEKISNGGSESIFKLLGKFGLDDDVVNAAMEWGAAGDLSSENSFIQFFDEPSIYRQVNVHSNLPRYKYVRSERSRLTAADVARLEGSSVLENYNRHYATAL